MKKLLATLVYLAPLWAFAQTPFDGTWVAKIDSAQLPKKPEVYSLNQGMYNCPTCTPKIAVKANGQDQTVSGDPYSDSWSVQVVDATTVEFTYKKDGKVVGTDSEMVSSDGNTLTDKFTDLSGTQPVTGEWTFSRVSPGEAGSHAISGSWLAAKLNRVSQNGLTVTYQGTSDGLKSSDPTGQGFDAKFDGQDYPITGDPGHSLISLRRIDANTIEATVKRQGKVVRVVRRTVSSDGRTMAVFANNTDNGTTISYEMVKQ
jgi:hypothetical protein